jgi:hypothetical protein
MDIRNLRINILYRMCEELTPADPHGPVETNLVYRIFSDIPKAEIDSSIQSLVAEALVREDKRRRQLYLTERGRSAIGATVATDLLPACKKPETDERG